MKTSLLKCLVAGACCGISASNAAAADTPKAVDDRLVVELFAAEPDIVTPTGIAVDAAGRVLVIESHTHMRPQNYQGPTADRIRRFEDTDGDGRADRITTLFEGTRWTMNLAFDRQERLYVATRNEIFRLEDANGDEPVAKCTQIVRMESAGNYPHNGLSGFAFDTAGNVYFGMGENLGVPYKLIGSDGSSQSGSEGGHLFRCAADGSKLQRWATGFWNPFHLAFDPLGRLFAVDNDPDSRPPCRLLHIVPGGNYGYKFRNGRSGLHPFTAWNGEHPGTLPMVAGTGEAPSGIVAYESTNLPADYLGQLLVTSWGDHRLDRFALEPQGASFRSVGKPFVTGGDSFRPVGIAVAPDGSLYVSDWADKSYEVHGKGRIWHIRAKDAKPAAEPSSATDSNRRRAPTWLKAKQRFRPVDKMKALAEKVAFGVIADIAQNPKQDVRLRAAAIEGLATAGQPNALHETLNSGNLSPELAQFALQLLPPGDATSDRFLDPAQPPPVRAAALRRVTRPELLPQVWAACEDADPFIQQAARLALGRLKVVDGNFDASGLSPAKRLAAILVLRETDQPPGKLLRQSLSDPDSRVRFVAVQWIGEERLADYRSALDDVLTAGPVSAELFAAYLAALERLDAGSGNHKDEWAGEQYMARALTDPKSPPAVRLWALRVLRPDHPLLSIAFLRELIDEGDMDFRREAILTLRGSTHPKRAAVLMAVAANPGLPPEARAEAIVGLRADTAEARALLVELAGGEVTILRHEALRSLVGTKLEPPERAALENAVKSHPADTSDLVARVLEPQRAVERPAATDIDAWVKLLEGPASAAEGERIFFHPHAAGCFRCHAVDGRGGRIGPDLATTGRALDRRRLVESILQPSKEVAPQFVTWRIETNDGRVLTGMLVREAVDGTQTFADEQGKQFSLHPRDIADRRAQNRSVMPDGLEKLLTVQEFRDLLAFLQQR